MLDLLGSRMRGDGYRDADLVGRAPRSGAGRGHPEHLTNRTQAMVWSTTERLALLTAAAATSGVFAVGGHFGDGLVEAVAAIEGEQHRLEVGVEGELDAALVELLAA